MQILIEPQDRIAARNRRRVREPRLVQCGEPPHKVLRVQQLAGPAKSQYRISTALRGSGATAFACQKARMACRAEAHASALAPQYHYRVPHQGSIDAALRAYVDAGTLAGAATLVWRDGRVVHTASMGCRDLVTNLPVERDTIFRIASMTKPLTTVAALMLYDEGRFALDEPIARHAPEFADLRVLRDPNGPLDQTDAAERPITFGDLLTHRSGLTYGEFHRGPIARACAEALGATIDNALGPDQWIARLATLPLIDQPGAGFHYGLSTDLLGFLIARLEGVSLGVCPRAAHLQAAGHARHGVRRSSREAKSPRGPLRVRRRGEVDRA